jgi:hypothetical protein
LEEIPLLLLIPALILVAIFPEPGEVWVYDDSYSVDDTGAFLNPVAQNSYQLDLPDILPEFMDFVWVYTYEMYIKLGYSSTFAEIQAWSEWDECSSLFGCGNPSHTLSKKMATAIKKATKYK